MPGYSLGHLENDVVLRNLDTLDTRDRATTASLLAHIGEVRARRLYADAGYSSMYLYCLGRLGYSEDMAGKRVTAARVARRFPFIFEAIADGRLHLTAICLLSKRLGSLRGVAARELIAAAERKTNDEIRRMLVERFPKQDLAPRVVELYDKETSESAPERVDAGGLLDGVTHAGPAMQPATLAPAAPAQREDAKPARTMPLSPGRFGLQLTMSAETYEKWRRVEELLATSVPRRDYAQRLDRALDALIEKLEKRRFGKTDSPRKARPSKNDDHIPAAVKRDVCERDAGQCTFQNASGMRCEKRGDLQYDHVRPKAMGGKSTTSNLRLRCHAHNQLEAERMFGVEFVDKKRAQAHASRHGRAPGPPPV